MEGKATALNFGIEKSDAEYVVCIDADTKLQQNAVNYLIANSSMLKEDNLAAVAGNVKVKPSKLFTKWQSIEYITSQNFDRLALRSYNAITVIPDRRF